LPQFPPFQELLQAKLLRAELEATRGDHAAALADLRGALHFAKIFVSGDGAVIHILAAMAIERSAMSAITWYALRADAEEPALQTLISAMEANEKSFDEGKSTALRIELSCWTLPQLHS